MLLNPFNTILPTIPGTRLLTDSLDLAGTQIVDPKDTWRVWTVQWLLAPIPGRAIGGIRARLLDQNGFATFCNQRDLEVLLGVARPGSKCIWMDDLYPFPEDHEWVGFCMDREDELDDLYERELRLRNGSVTPLAVNTEITRRLHHDQGNDTEELLTLISDTNKYTEVTPDTTFETIEYRWVHIEKTKMEWG